MTVALNNNRHWCLISPFINDDTIVLKDSQLLQKERNSKSICIQEGNVMCEGEFMLWSFYCICIFEILVTSNLNLNVNRKSSDMIYIIFVMHM